MTDHQNLKTSALLLLMLGAIGGTPSLATADDIVVCDPNGAVHPVLSYQTGVNGPSYYANPQALVWEAPNAAMTPQRLAQVDAFATQRTALQGTPVKYWKCTYANGLPTGFVGMTQAERDAVDAPQIAEAVRQQAFTNEIVTSPVCNKELSTLATIKTNWIAARQASLDAASTNAQVKTWLRDELVPEVADALYLIEKCSRSRAQ